jgi:hypothetical protein
MVVVGGRIDVTSKDAGEQLAIVGIELYCSLYIQRTRKRFQSLPRNYPSAPPFVCWRLKSALAPSWAHTERDEFS